MPFENWEEDHKLNLKKILIVGLIAMLAVAGTAFAVYKIISPSSPPVVVNTPASLSTPTVNATVAIVGDTLQISTTLSDASPGVQVFFYEGASQLAGSVYTDSAGTAIYLRPLATAGSFTYHAECVHP